MHGFIIPAHDKINDQPGEEADKDHLTNQDDHQRYGKIDQFPQLQVVDGHGQIEGQGDIGDDFDAVHIHAGLFCQVTEVAHDGTGHHRTNVDRQGHPGVLEKQAQECTGGDGDQYQSQR